MNAKWSIISTVVLFISAGIAVFVFAQTGVGVTADILRMDTISKKIPITENVQIDMKPVARTAAAITARQIRSFDDTDRFVAREMGPLTKEKAAQEEAAAGDNSVATVTATENSTNSGLVGTPVLNVADTSTDNSVSTKYSSSSVTRPVVDPLPPQEDIPMPRLPSIGGDYDNGDEDQNGASGVTLPQLPDVT